MTVSVVDFDRQPFLLNCTNGTLNLETGEIYPHRRSDRLMKLYPHAYDAAARCPEFLRFLGSGNVYTGEWAEYAPPWEGRHGRRLPTLIPGLVLSVA